MVAFVLKVLKKQRTRCLVSSLVTDDTFDCFFLYFCNIADKDADYIKRWFVFPLDGIDRWH